VSVNCCCARFCLFLFVASICNQLILRAFF
jgi:hypothetical protein